VDKRTKAQYLEAEVMQRDMLRAGFKAGDRVMVRVRGSHGPLPARFEAYVHKKFVRVRLSETRLSNGKKIFVPATHVERRG
jgi:hypothetical protein